MKKVLVTGGTGFVGRHALRPLKARGFEVHAVTRHRMAEDGDVFWHQADLLHSNSAQEIIERVKPSHLLHLAWCADPVNFWHTPENLEWLNATRQLLRAFIKHGGQRFVGAGSCAEYEWTDNITCHEFKSQTRPFSLYGETKKAVGQLLETTTSASLTSTAWGRLFFVYGPWGHPRRIPAVVIQPLLNSRPAKCSSGTQYRDYMFVEDAANAFAALLDSDVTGPVNIASGNSVQLQDLFRSIAGILNCDHLLEIGAIPDTKTNNPKKIAADVSRLATEVKFKPAVSLSDGLHRTIEWWKKTAAKHAA